MMALVLFSLCFSAVFTKKSHQEPCLISYTRPEACPWVDYPLAPSRARNASDFYNALAVAAADEILAHFYPSPASSSEKRCHTAVTAYACAFAFPRCLGELPIDTKTDNDGFPPCVSLCNAMDKTCPRWIPAESSSILNGSFCPTNASLPYCTGESAGVTTTVIVVVALCIVYILALCVLVMCLAPFCKKTVKEDPVAGVNVAFEDDVALLPDDDSEVDEKAYGSLDGDST